MKKMCHIIRRVTFVPEILPIWIKIWNQRVYTGGLKFEALI